MNMRHVVMTNEKHRNGMEARHSTKMEEAMQQAQGRYKSGVKAA